MIDIRVFHDKEAWLDGILDDFIQTMAGIPAFRQPRLCLAGGQTPEPVYRSMARLMVDGVLGPAPVILVPGDERVSIGRPADLNETMLRRSFATAIDAGAATLYSWFDEPATGMVAGPGATLVPGFRVGILPDSVHADAADPAIVTRLAWLMIRTMEARLASLSNQGQPLFDLCYLGMGADGHTAGLFPGMPALDHPGLCVRGLAPQAPRQRVSLGFAALSSSGRTRFILSSAGKEAALESLRSGDPGCPAARAAAGDSIAFVLA